MLDLDGDGRLDLLGLTAEGTLARAINQGKTAYHWQTIRPLAIPQYRRCVERIPSLAPSEAMKVKVEYPRAREEGRADPQFAGTPILIRRHTRNAFPFSE